MILSHPEIGSYWLQYSFFCDTSVSLFRYTVVSIRRSSVHGGCTVVFDSLSVPCLRGGSRKLPYRNVCGTKTEDRRSLHSVIKHHGTMSSGSFVYVSWVFEKTYGRHRFILTFFLKVTLSFSVNFSYWTWHIPLNYNTFTLKRDTIRHLSYFISCLPEIVSPLKLLYQDFRLILKKLSVLTDGPYPRLFLITILPWWRRVIILKQFNVIKLHTIFFSSSLLFSGLRLGLNILIFKSYTISDKV